MTATGVPVVIDLSPIVRAAPAGPARRLRSGDTVRVRFVDGLGIEAPHELDGLVVRRTGRDRLVVRIGRTRFEVPEAACRRRGEPFPEAGQAPEGAP